MFLRSLCQCVFSSNTGFSPYYAPPPPPFLSSLLMVTHPPPLNFMPNLIYLVSIIFQFLHFLELHPSCSSPTPHHFHSSVHSLIHHSLIHHIWFPPPNFLHQPSSTFPLLLISVLSLSLPHPVHFVLLLPSSLPLSLSHSALCLALSGWAAPRWLRVCVHSGACRASPPPGLTTRFCLSSLNSAAPPPLPPLLPLPTPQPSLFFVHST